ncbi:hypothetical protein WG936_02790 [Corynebacterium sp. H127]|uniref:hypothetical protein n=1 Tax=Corynebacterium sp. H127 TaxID=3133418 RepID=UPI0030B63002
MFNSKLLNSVPPGPMLIAGWFSLLILGFVFLLPTRTPLVAILGLVTCAVIGLACYRSELLSSRILGSLSAVIGILLWIIAALDTMDPGDDVLSPGLHIHYALFTVFALGVALFAATSTRFTKHASAAAKSPWPLAFLLGYALAGPCWLLCSLYPFSQDWVISQLLAVPAMVGVLQLTRTLAVLPSPARDLSLMSSIIAVIGFLTVALSPVTWIPAALLTAIACFKSYRQT